jgi:hypothetical protein
VNYAFQFSGPRDRPRGKLLLTGDISHNLAGVELSSTNSLSDTTVSNKTALSRAAMNEHEAVVELLLEEGAEVKCRSNSGQTPLW